MKKRNIKTLEQFKDEQYGKRGTSMREKLENGYETFKRSFIIQKILQRQAK